MQTIKVDNQKERRAEKHIRAVIKGRNPLLQSLALICLAAWLLIACSRASGQSAAASGHTIQNKGSDTMVNLALAWAEAYHTVNPDLLVAVTGGGSGTGIAALINGTVDIANASRQMKADEIAEAKANGIEPTEF
ncbi:MAG TPA: substrate-binding domain-containing protein, partial [Caldilineaceae bacterium]|nr:substrate-binding domain-containing protein [Caldilineaceae bacterium]